MNNCAVCGEPIRHADQIVVVEYNEDVVKRADLNHSIQAFGQSECREIFENHYYVENEEINEEIIDE